MENDHDHGPPLPLGQTHAPGHGHGHDARHSGGPHGHGAHGHGAHAHAAAQRGSTKMQRKRGKKASCMMQSPPSFIKNMLQNQASKFSSAAGLGKSHSHAHERDPTHRPVTHRNKLPHGRSKLGMSDPTYRGDSFHGRAVSSASGHSHLNQAQLNMQLAIADSHAAADRAQAAKLCQALSKSGSRLSSKSCLNLHSQRPSNFGEGHGMCSSRPSNFGEMIHAEYEPRTSTHRISHAVAVDAGDRGSTARQTSRRGGPSNVTFEQHGGGGGAHASAGSSEEMHYHASPPPPVMTPMGSLGIVCSGLSSPMGSPMHRGSEGGRGCEPRLSTVLSSGSSLEGEQSEGAPGQKEHV